MQALTENTIQIDLKSVKSTGLRLTQLGIPVLESTQIKKGTAHEFLQSTADGKVGRRYQNIQVTAARTAEGGVESAKVFLHFEVFGDDNVPVGANAGYTVTLLSGADALLTLPVSRLFLPYGRAWYENQAVFDVALDVFAKADRLQLTVMTDQVRLI